MTEVESQLMSATNSILHYAIDTDKNDPIKVLNHQLELTPGQFFGELYSAAVNTQDLQELLDEDRKHAVLCVVGYRGQGKSSYMHWIHHVLGSLEPRAKSCVINMFPFSKKANGTAGLGDHVKIADALSNIVAMRVLEELSREVNCERYIAWLTSGPPDETDNFSDELLTDMHHLYSEMSNVTKCRKEKRAARVDFIEDEYRKNSELFSNIQGRVHQLLNIAQAVQATVSLTDSSRYVLLVDNVDQIEPAIQSALLNEMRRTRSLVSARAQFLCAIRRENVIFTEDSASGGTVPIRLLDNSHRHFSRQIPFADSEMATVVSRRIKAAKARIETIAKKIPSTPIYEGIRRIQDYLGNVELVVTQGQVATHLLTLANYDRRTAMDVLLRFVRELDKSRSRLGHGSMYDSRHLETLLSMWICDAADSIGLYVPDVFMMNGTIDDERPAHALLYIDHLTLTTLLNLEVNSEGGPQRPSEAPSTDKLVRWLGKLGYPQDIVIESVFKLGNQSGGRFHAIEFVDVVHDVKQALKRSSGIQLRLTPGGTCAVKWLFNRVGFVWAKAFKFVEGSGNPLHHYLEKNDAQRLAILIPWLCQMAKRHVEVMTRVAAVFQPLFDSRWLDKYKMHHAVQGELQLERILHSARVFYKGDAHVTNVAGGHDDIVRIEEWYQRQLRNMSDTGWTIAGEREEIDKIGRKWLNIGRR